MPTISVAYCDQCGFYYDTGHCETCDDGEIREENAPEILDIDEETSPYTGRWLTILIFFSLLLVFASNLYTMGMERDVVFSYGVAVVLYAMMLEWEIRCLAEYEGEGIDWSPDLATWRRLALGVVLSAGLLSVVVTPYYVYMRLRYVSFPVDGDTT